MGDHVMFPRGTVRHQDLSTAYTHVPGLLASLKTEGFSGTVVVEFPREQGVFFLVSGDLVNGELRKDAGPARMTGQEAVRSLLSLSQRKDGLVSVYGWPPERVARMANNLDSEILFPGLSTDFTRLDRLIVTLREGKHEGFIELMTKEKAPLGILFFEGGEPVDLLVTSNSEPVMVEKKSIPVFLENAVKHGVLLNVYKSQSKTSPREPIVLETVGEAEEIIPILQEMLSSVERGVDARSGQGTFVRTFKRALIEKSEDFPFLDPFGGEFEYRQGTITFAGEAKAREFTKGIGETLRLTLHYLEEEVPKNKMHFLKLRTGMESYLEKKRDQLKRLGVDSVVTTFLQ